MIDLVEKLRLKSYTSIEDIEDMIAQAADRIEDYETLFNHERSSNEWARKRISELEAALREIAGNDKNCTSLDYAMHIARRALEGKHE